MILRMILVLIKLPECLQRGDWRASIKGVLFAALALCLVMGVGAGPAEEPKGEPSRKEAGPPAPDAKEPRPEAKAKSRRALSLEERMEALEEQLEKGKLDRAVKKYESVGGLGPAASGVYWVDEGLSWGGYGEVKYRDYRSPLRTDEADVHRFILYAGYRFSDWIVLNTEIEYEHAGFEEKTFVSAVDFPGARTTTSTTNSSEVFVEFAYIDLKFADAFQVALGLNLVPVGIVNYMHEPTTFFAVERPVTESNLIPTTWREIGAIAHGEFFRKNFVYRLGVLNGQRAASFASGNWIRNGRTKGSLARASDYGGVANLEFKGIQNLTVGGSFYSGQADQNEIKNADFESRWTMFPNSTTLSNTNLAGLYEIQNTPRASVRVNLAEGHFDYRGDAFSIRGLLARGWLSEEDAREVNRATGRNVGKTVEGAYVEAGYNVARFFGWKHKLYAFVRGEYVNTQKNTVERHFGGREDWEDLACAQVPGGYCRTTTRLPNGNRDLGVIAASDASKELYGVKGVPDRTNDRRIMTYGLAYFPHPNVSLKLDYEQQSSKTEAFRDQEIFTTSNNKIDRANFAVTFIF